MATSKPSSAKPKKVMDVSKPSETKASATSKPVITGHKPLIGDPMVRDDVPVSQLSPTDSEDKPVAESQDEVEPTKETPAKQVKTENDTIESSDDIPSEDLETKPSSKSDNNRLKPSDELVAEVNQKAKAKQQDKADGSLSINKSAANTSADDNSNLEESEMGEALGDAKGVKEAELAELERAEAAQKLIANGKYRVKLGAAAHHKGGLRGSTMFAFIMLLLVAALGYLAIDSGFYKSSIKLPFHVFKQTALESDDPVAVVTKKATTSTTPSSTDTTNNSTNSTIPTNFKAYKMVDSGVSFAYPSSWGNVLATPEKGYTKRDSSLNSSGVYAYIATFSKNKDVELAVTSNKYLPAARDRLYYDYLQWCTVDSSFYNSLLGYKTSAGVDTADKVICDQGPISAVKLDTKTLQQVSVKDPKTSIVIGDIYTQNLTSTSDIVVVHVKDASGKNSADIITLLSTVK